MWSGARSLGLKGFRASGYFWTQSRAHYAQQAAASTLNPPAAIRKKGPGSSELISPLPNMSSILFGDTMVPHIE